jgi:undecaprenyl diphosphate synthase
VSWESLLEEVKSGHLPVHVGIIMDGNGRWAKARGLPRLEGHRRGALTAERIVRFVAREKLFPYLTLFAFSTENWGRPKHEVEGLFALLEEFLREKADEFVESGIRLLVVGDHRPLPEGLQRAIEEVERRTSGNDLLTLTVALNFGGRWAILRAARDLLRAARSIAMGADEVTENLFRAYLPTGELPDMDLLIRTGGRLRLSNFLLWELAYAELYFTDTLWPDFDEGELLRALRDFQGRERSFGKATP